ncbi:Crp/Fnr family transcriptional regulator [Flagellimonas sp. DF-77]|uniref:Crp/Fnr family transcriptional regulator n=1 Tax=Flagellimonas algarum TaxID=3230298 RepID=UPI0033915E45
MYEDLKTYITAKVPLSERDIERFCGYFKARSLAKKAYLLKEGQRCRHYFFIRKGLLRSYFTDEKGKEVITSFAIERWWLTDIEGLSLQQPASVNIQALEETELWAISFDELETASREIPGIDRLFRIIAERRMVALQRRHYHYLRKSSQERYAMIMKELPGFVQRIPQYMLASYLDMSPEYLSELRKK